MRAMTLALLTVWLLAPASAGAAQPIDVCNGRSDCGVSGGGQSITWVYNPVTQQLMGIVGRSPGDAGPDLDYFLVPECATNNPTASNPWGDGDLCQGAACPGGGIWMWVFTRPHNAPDQAPVRQGTECMTAQLNVPLAAVQQSVRDQLQRWLESRRFDTPALVVDPPTHLLVRLPTIFSTDPVATTTIPISGPFTGEITVVPRVQWQFGDGPEPADGPDSAGAPYDGTDPRVDPAHYPVTHTYDRAGRYAVRVSVQWQATDLVVPGVGDYPVDATATGSTTRTVTVRGARAVLTDG